MTITDLKVSVILSHSGHKNGKRKKVTDRKSVGKKAIANPVREKRKQSLTARRGKSVANCRRKKITHLSYAGQNRSLIVSVVKKSVTVHKHSDYKL